MSTPKEIIETLLKMAENDKDFIEWKKQNPIDTTARTMTKEERTQYIIEMLIELGFININEDDTETEDSETAV